MIVPVDLKEFMEDEEDEELGGYVYVDFFWLKLLLTCVLVFVVCERVANYFRRIKVIIGVNIIHYDDPQLQQQQQIQQQQQQQQQQLQQEQRQVILYNAECPICLSKPRLGLVTNCGHVYCGACLMGYLEGDAGSDQRCPMCQQFVDCLTPENQNHLVYKKRVTNNARLHDFFVDFNTDTF